MRDQPVCVPFGTREIADPQEDPWRPGQGKSQRCRMVLPFGILDGLPHALRGLGRMAFQPEVTGEADADQNMVIQPEIDLARLPRMGPVAERSLELHARIAVLADKLERPSQNGICQGHCRRIFRGTINGPAELCIVQRGFEMTVADLEHRQHAQQPHLVEDVAACLGDRQASAQGRARRLALPAHLHRRNAEARLEMHLLGPAASGIIESADRSLRPAVAFREQGLCQEDRCGGGGESDAKCKITVVAEAPFQSRANIVDVGKWGRSLLPLMLNSFEQPAKVFRMPSGIFLQFAALGQLRQGINPRRLEQSTIASTPGDVRCYQGFCDQVRDTVGNFCFRAATPYRHGAGSLE